MLPNLAALARDGTATGGSASEDSQSAKARRLPDADDRAHGPSLSKVLPEELLRQILLAIDTDDVEAACRTVYGWCGADTDVKTACADGPMWKTLTERVFKSTKVDQALFAHDELLETDPEKAFKMACLDRQIARAVGLKFLWQGLSAVKRRLYDSWRDREMAAEDDDSEHNPLRYEVHDDEKWSATDIMDTFYVSYPAMQKFTEWQLLAADEYKKKKIKWFKTDGFTHGELFVYVSWAAQGPARAQSFGFEKEHVFGETSHLLDEDWPRTPVHAEGWDVLMHMVQTSNLFEKNEPWKAYFERVRELVHALAERVGMATVWMWHKSDRNMTDEHAKIALGCVRAFPDTRLSKE